VAPVRVVIDYRVSVIDYQGKYYFLVGPSRGVINYRVSLIDYQGKNYFPGLVVVR